MKKEDIKQIKKKKLKLSKGKMALFIEVDKVTRCVSITRSDSEDILDLLMQKYETIKILKKDCSIIELFVIKH